MFSDRNTQEIKYWSLKGRLSRWKSAKITIDKKIALSKFPCWLIQAIWYWKTYTFRSVWTKRRHIRQEVSHIENSTWNSPLSLSHEPPDGRWIQANGLVVRPQAKAIKATTFQEDRHLAEKARKRRKRLYCLSTQENSIAHEGDWKGKY